MKLVVGVLVVVVLSLLSRWSEGAGCTTVCTEDNKGYKGYTCGDRLGCDKNKLYYCKVGKMPEEIQDCAQECSQSGEDKDFCRKCEYCPSKLTKDEKVLYCGKTVGPNCAARAVYTCASDGANPIQLCAKSCVGTGDGKAHCESCKCPGKGMYCGAEIGCPITHILDCPSKGGAATITDVCGSYCSRDDKNKTEC